MSTNTSAIQNKLVVSVMEHNPLVPTDSRNSKLHSPLSIFHFFNHPEEMDFNDSDDDESASDFEDDVCINYSIGERLFLTNQVHEVIAVRYMHLHVKNLEERSKYNFPGPERRYDEVWKSVADMLPVSAQFICQRHKYAEMCPVGALGFYFLSFLKNSTDSQTLTSQNLPLWFHRLAIDLSTREAKADIGNYEAFVHGAAPELEAGSEDDALILYNKERLKIELPPRSLLFPLPQWIVEFRTGCIRDDAYWSEPFVPAKQALSEYTEFVVYLVRVALQDGAVLYLKNPRHPLLNTHGVFQSAQFKEYVEGFETKARALSAQTSPASCMCMMTHIGLDFLSTRRRTCDGKFQDNFYRSLER